jgi:hypothetical protein
MHFNEIDEIIKRGLQESERKSENYALAAKERIWESIEKPKKKSGLLLGFVLAMAAAFTLLLVSTFLFLKLQSKEKEFFALQIDRNRESPSEVSGTEIFKSDELVEAEKIPIIIEEPISETKPEKSNQVVKKQNLAKAIEKEIINEAYPEIDFSTEILAMVPYPEIEIPENIPLESKAELLLSHQEKEETPKDPLIKKQSKLRFRFGSNSQTFNSGKSLALNIKF